MDINTHNRLPHRKKKEEYAYNYAKLCSVEMPILNFFISKKY